MSVQIVSALIAAFTAIIVAGSSYWFTKQREREAAWRKEKLDHYKAFTVSLSGVITGEGTPQGRLAFSKASNDLNLIAPQAVIVALQAFQHETRTSNTVVDREKQERLMSKLFYEMRKDLGISDDDDQETFRVGLWASGNKAQDQPS